uniref:DUF676 domain-containing protein n=1 Tax=Brugia timori TaxID=42155 RepID=A0A0R3R816_9BILA
LLKEENLKHIFIRCRVINKQAFWNVYFDLFTSFYNQLSSSVHVLVVIHGLGARIMQNFTIFQKN